MSVLRVAAAAYPIQFLANWREFEKKITKWVNQAVSLEAELLVFPEYAALELISLLPHELHHNVIEIRPALQKFLPHFIALHQKLADKNDVCLIAGSFPVEVNGTFMNRSYVFAAGQQPSWQDKLVMTRFEAEEWQITPTTEVNIFEWKGFVFGIAICYDSEFPTLANALAEAGAEFLIVPSFTSSLAGFTRVRVGSMARSLENQMYVIHAPLLADAHWTYAIEEAHGKASIYAPA